MPRLPSKPVRRFTLFALTAFTLGSSVTAASAGHEYVVPIANMSFGPLPSGLKVGDSIVFVNKDSVPHTITARDHSFDLRIGAGQRGRISLTRPGTYPIYCILHAQMRGSLTVGT